MSVVEGCELTQILFKKFGYLERRVTYLEGKSRDQQLVIEELQTKSKSQENIIHELQSELKKKTTSRNQEGHSSDEEFDESVDVEVEVNPNLDELTGPIQNTIILEEDDKLSQKLVAQLGTRYSEKPPQRLENTFENSAAEVETEPKSKISQCKTKGAQQKAKTGGKSSKSKEKVKKSHICLFCSKSCGGFEHLSRHIRVHTRERPFECKICSKSFSCLSNLKKHTRVHTGERPFTCPVCSKSFAYKQVWDRHMISHSGEKRFPCSVCPKKLADNPSLKKHMMIHSGEKPFSCWVLSCPMAYSTSAGLKYHMSKHFGTYSCSICSQRFGSKYLLKIHEKVHTGETSGTKNSFEENSH